MIEQLFRRILYTGAVRATCLVTRRTAPLKKLIAPKRYSSMYLLLSLVLILLICLLPTILFRYCLLRHRPLLLLTPLLLQQLYVMLQLFSLSRERARAKPDPSGAMENYTMVWCSFMCQRTAVAAPVEKALGRY